MTALRAIAQQYIDTKLRIRLGIFFAIFIALTAYSFYDVFVGKIVWYLALIGIVLWLVVGYIVGRLMTLKWHPSEEKVISQLDVIGTIVITLYIALEIGKTWIFGHWLQGPTLSAFTLALLGGMLGGRFLGMWVNIRQLLSERFDEK